MLLPWVRPVPPLSQRLSADAVAPNVLLVPHACTPNLSTRDPKWSLHPPGCHWKLSTPPRCPLPPAVPQLTMIQSGKGTWDRVWELSEVTEGTPMHHSREKSHGVLTV